MDLGLAGRSAWITGASKGIGAACADRLAEAGCSLKLIARTEADLEQTADDLRRRRGVKVEAYAADLSQSEAVHALWTGAPPPDILVNNAGAIPSGTIADVQEDRWRQSWELKVFGYINMCREALARMSERGSGVIINVIGVGGEKPRPSYAAGAGGNAALMALTRALGSDSLASGVRVVGVNPGLIHTGRLETQMRFQANKRFGDAERWREMLDPKFPPGEPDHIAAMVALLASDLSANTTGTIVTIDGGAAAR
jgi:NAD(P)-dependent dehydrogenase (short-subunit alcohol dehydrogenase family)